MTSIREDAEKAVRDFWRTRNRQGKRQGSAGSVRDAGNRTMVTGGKQMLGFEKLVERRLVAAGVPKASIRVGGARELPGYYRAEKNWDLLVVHKGALIAAVEFKSQIGSLGNNFNNRSEEAIGNATDLWTAFREGAFKVSPRPWLGFLMLLEDSPRARTPVSVREPHFPVFDEFKSASYAARYEILIRRMLRERLYDSGCLILADPAAAKQGCYTEPSPELGIDGFIRSLLAHASAHVG